MHDRQLTPLDRILSGVDRALRTVAGPPGHASRSNPAGEIADGELDVRDRRHSAGLMRVNHAGEVAAQALYQGHATVARDPEVARHMVAAAAEERDHLAWCAERLTELDSSVSRLRPLWFAGSWLIGAASGALGDRWSLGFVEETERQVAAHLDEHLQQLPANDRRSQAIVRRMRDEEIEHGANARRRGAAALPAPVRAMMRMSARVMTRTAYWW